MLLVSIIFGLVAASSAVFLEHGHCPKVTTYEYDMVKFSGIWIPYLSTKNKYDPVQDCTTLYWAYPDGDVTLMNTTSISADTGETLRIESTLIKSKKNNALLSANSVPLLGKVDSRFFTLGYDTNSFSVAFDCHNYGSKHEKWIILYTRDRQPSQQVLEEARKILEKNGLSMAGLVLNNQEDCDLAISS